MFICFHNGFWGLDRACISILVMLCVFPVFPGFRSQKEGCPFPSERMCGKMADLYVCVRQESLGTDGRTCVEERG